MKSITFSVGEKVWVAAYQICWEVKEYTIRRFDIEEGHFCVYFEETDECYFLDDLCKSPEQAEIQIKYVEDFR